MQAAIGPGGKRWLVEEWSIARRQADRSEDGLVFVLDEIQAISDWSRVVKGLWDADRRHGRRMHVVLLDSAPLPIQSGLNESLAGRFETIPVKQWSFSEVREAFGLSLDQFLFFGGYPAAATLVGTPERWRDFVLRAIVQASIERDVVSLTAVQKPALLQRLFREGAKFSGQILSYRKLVGFLAERGSVVTAQKYLDLLQQAGLLAGLPAFSKSGKLDRRSSPKFIALDPAFITADSGYSFQEARSDRTFWGRIVESAVGSHVLNSASSRLRVSYWRKEDSGEVDFVLQRGPRTIAIEVKSGRRRRSLPGIGAFRKSYPGTGHLVVGPGGTSLDEFLGHPASHWFETQ